MKQQAPIPSLQSAAKPWPHLVKAAFLILISFISIIQACKKPEIENQEDPVNSSGIPESVITQLERAGFETTEGLRPFKDGYLVEYDLYLTKEQISKLSDSDKTPAKKGANGISHFVTNGLLAVPAGSTRNIRVYMDPGFGSFMQNAFDEALLRYNSVDLNITFSRTTNASEADIQITSFYEESPTLGVSGGFPVAGNPASNIWLNTFYYNDFSTRADAATTIAHEIGHAVGFRHTDFMNRTFSCGSGGNEGDAGVGAVHVPGTPTTPSSGSWMLACSNNTNRPFTSEDLTALRAVYPKPGIIWSMSEGQVPYFADNNLLITVNGTTAFENFGTANGVFSNCANGDVITVHQWFQTSVYPWPASGAMSRLTVKVDGATAYDSETDGPVGKSFTFTKEAGKIYEVISSTRNKAVKIVWSNIERISPHADSNLSIDINGSTTLVEWGTANGTFSTALAGSTATFNQFYVLPDYVWPANTRAQLVVKENGVTINGNSGFYTSQVNRSFSTTLQSEKTYEVVARTSN